MRKPERAEDIGRDGPVPASQLVTDRLKELHERLCRPIEANEAISEFTVFEGCNPLPVRSTQDLRLYQVGLAIELDQP